MIIKIIIYFWNLMKKKHWLYKNNNQNYNTFFNLMKKKTLTVEV